MRVSRKALFSDSVKEIGKRVCRMTDYGVGSAGQAMNRICFVDDVGTLCFLPEKEYAKKENWDVIRQSVVDRYSDLYSYLVAHRSDFVKSVGERTVNTLLERLYIPDLMDYACGKKEYDAGQLLALSTDMQKAEIPDASMCYLLYDIAKLRGTKKYPELIELMKTRGRELEGRRLPVELSFESPELSKSERELIGGFLKEEAGRESEGSNSKKYLSALAQHILVGQEAGISFDVHTFAEAMEKAKAENKLVFMDCYTTWCGPCRMMAAQVFTQQKVGDYFNEHFVSLKMDMEKGEGITLGKKYGVTAYPTMLILDTQGNVMHTMVGSRSAEELIKEAREHSDPTKGYAVSKAAYEAGERTPDAIANYITALVSAKELTALQGDSLATTYLDGWDDAKFCDASSWPLLEAAVVNPQRKAFSRLLKLHDGLTKAVPAEGVPGRFIVDTGAPCCVSHSFAEKAGIRDEGRTAQGVDSNGAAVSTSVVNIPSLKLDSVFTFTRLQAMKWAEGDMLENLHIDGVIGYNLLKQGILKLDARTGSMTFTNYDGGLGIDYTRAIPMLPDSYLTMLRVQLKDGACDTVMFDSGAKSFYELSMKSFSNLRTAGKALEVKGAGQGVLSLGAAGLEGKSQKYRVVIPQFRLGNFLFEEVTSVTTDAVDSRIGSDLLRYGTVIADYRSNVFYFIPYDNRKKLNLYEKDWDVVITVMDDHLCAGLVWDYAGLPLHGGERIVAVNGVRYDKVDLYEAITKGLIHLPGDKARIVYIGEDGKEHEVTIRKR